MSSYEWASWEPWRYQLWNEIPSSFEQSPLRYPQKSQGTYFTLVWKRWKEIGHLTTNGVQYFECFCWTSIPYLERTQWWDVYSTLIIFLGLKEYLERNKDKFRLVSVDKNWWRYHQFLQISKRKQLQLWTYTPVMIETYRLDIRVGSIFVEWQKEQT